MAIRLAAFLLAALLACCVSAGESHSGSDVVVLTAANIDKYIDGSRNVFVKFYAPWCGHCKNMAPAWNELATTFKAEDATVIIADVDATIERELGERFGVQGYPTIKFFPRGTTKGEDYNGGRDTEGLVKFVNQRCGTFRKPGGALMAEAGRLSAMEAPLAKFAKATDAAGRAEAVADVASAVEKLTDKGEAKLGAFYKKMFEKAAAAGGSAEPLLKERERLEKLRASGSVSAEQKTYVFQRINILTQIAEAMGAATKKEEL